jgi:hypothetical protein
VALDRWAAGGGESGGGQVIATANYLSARAQQRVAILVGSWRKGQIEAGVGAGKVLLEGFVVLENA